MFDLLLACFRIRRARIESFVGETPIVQAVSFEGEGGDIDFGDVIVDGVDQIFEVIGNVGNG